jgi:hypothetical protein
MVFMVSTLLDPHREWPDPMERLNPDLGMRDCLDAYGVGWGTARTAAAVPPAASSQYMRSSPPRLLVDLAQQDLGSRRP